MLFNSYLFVFVFLPIVLFSTFLIARKASQHAALVWLFIASLFFYSWWNPAFLYVLGASMAVNYSLALFFDARFSALLRKIIVTTGVVFNLTLLWYYKYATAMLSTLMSTNVQLPGNDMGLPLAISFFTFQQIAYLIDSYRTSMPQKKILPYALFLTFFPHLISGPIVRHGELIPQFFQKDLFIFNHKHFFAGLLLFAIGLTKKTILADSLSILADNGWGNVSQISMVEGWIVTLAWTLRLYFDVSAYSDMAIGVALMLNLHLPVNFQSPYRASNIIDAWQRWHMSLTRWINHYLYRPLLRYRKKFSFSYSMIITFLCMVVIGVWHGAAWSYIAFGVVHGIALVINHVWRKNKLGMPTAAGHILTFTFVTLAMLLNTSHSLQDIAAMYTSLFHIEPDRLLLLRPDMLDIGQTAWGQFFLGQTTAHAWLGRIAIITLLLSSLFIVFFPKNSNDIVGAFQLKFPYAILTAVLLILGLMGISEYRPFYYFQF